MNPARIAFCSVALCFASSGCAVSFGDRDDDRQCVDSCASCEVFSGDELQCARQRGCSWASGHCSGSCRECSEESIEDVCQARPECSWNSMPPCQGTCIECSDGLTESGCGDLGAHCTWSAGGCGSVATPCVSLSEPQCNVGCSWVPARCYGPLPHSCVYIIDATLCDSRVSCFWAAGTCEGDTFLCSGIDTSTDCGLTGVVCEWEPAVCDGTPTSCSSRAQSDCHNGCNWQDGTCLGPCLPCEDLSSSEACSNQPGCEWSIQEPCSGSCSPCETHFEVQSCGEQPGCSWVEGDHCLGTCTTCASFETQDDCLAQSGCLWE